MSALLNPLLSAKQWLLVNATRSPVITALLLLMFGYALNKLIIHFKNELRIKYWYDKLPSIPRLGYAGWLLGNIEVYYYYLFFMPREKAVMQLLSAFYNVNLFQTLGIARFTLGFQRLVALFQNETVEELITSMANIEKSEQYKFFEPWLGLGLLTSTDDKWKRHRKLLTPAFHFKILESFFPVMNDNTNLMMERFEKIVLKSNAQHKGIDIRLLIADCTLDTICETAMGVPVGAQSDNSNVDYVESINRVLVLVMNRMMNPLVHKDSMYSITPNGFTSRAKLRKIHSFVQRIIRERREELEKTIKEKNLNVDKIASEDMGLFTKKRYAFLDSLLLAHFQQPQSFTMKDIQDEVNTFMFEGHDTTSISLIFSLLLTASDERVQEKVYEELDSIFGGDDRQITLEDTRQMKYLEMVIKESLRLYPSVPFIGRTVNQDFEVKGYRIPAGCTCAIFIYYLHRDKRIFPHPEKFIPERFEPDQPVHKMPYAYMPFSAGPRNCIGQKFAMLEMKIVLASIIRKYRMTAITKRDTIEVGFSVLTKADTPVVIQFDKRE